jgi:hypothetical protein
MGIQHLGIFENAAELRNICRDAIETNIKGAEHRNIFLVFRNNNKSRRNEETPIILLQISRCASPSPSVFQFAL